jgi:hypothetical protein
LLLPLIPTFAKQFKLDEKLVGGIVTGIPGIFGFLVWELKENWKLYRANAAKQLNPVVIGSHGEKMRALLRPGFHSGVVPKTFAKWRRASQAGNLPKARHWEHYLHHIVEALERLVSRELVPYLNASTRACGTVFSSDHPHLSTNKVRFPFHVSGLPNAIVVAIEERAGWIIGSIEQRGPLDELASSCQTAFADMALGLYKLCGVHVTREQTAAVVGPQGYHFDATEDGLNIVERDGQTKFYDYDDGIELGLHQRKISDYPLMLSDRPIDWSAWVNHWESEKSTGAPSELLPNWKVI